MLLALEPKPPILRQHVARIERLIGGRSCVFPTGLGDVVAANLQLERGGDGEPRAGAWLPLRALRYLE